MIGKVKILPVLIVAASAGLAFKINNIAIGVDNMVAPVVAQENMSEENNMNNGEEPNVVANTAPPRNTTDPLMMSRAELDLLQDLVNRREELNARDAQISVRERLLETTERRIDGKIAQLEDLEVRISALVETYEANENEQMGSIVKVYETMKPKDAARIFERLSMSIQLDVAIRMKESKMALIMAQMSNEAAELLTSELAHRASLPELEG